MFRGLILTSGVIGLAGATLLTQMPPETAADWLFALALWGFALALLLVVGLPGQPRSYRPAGRADLRAAPWPPSSPARPVRPAAPQVSTPSAAPILQVPVICYDANGRATLRYADLLPPPGEVTLESVLRENAARS